MQAVLFALLKYLFIQKIKEDVKTPSFISSYFKIKLSQQIQILNILYIHTFSEQFR